jgi:hypothetical protein
MRSDSRSGRSSQEAHVRPDHLVEREPDDAGWMLPPRLSQLLMMLVGLSSAAALVLFGLVAALRLNSYYRINHVSGSWMGLTQYADTGPGIYPPLYDRAHQVYGGTRFMPETILLNTAASKITGEYLASGKLVTLLCSLLLLTLTFVVLRRLGCPISISLGLMSAVLATLAGFDSAFTIRGDALPVFWQLLAVTLVASSQRSRYQARWVALAAVLCVFAVLSKFSAIWGLAAICIWLIIKRQRSLVVLFSGVFLVALLGSFGLLQIISHGRMLDNVLGLSLAGVGGSSPLARVRELGRYVLEGTQAVWVLFPFAVLGMVLAARNRRLNLYQLSFVCALAVTLVIFTDSGAGPNHLLDMVVLTVILIGDFWAQVAPRSGMLATAQVILALLVLWVVPSAHASNFLSDYRTDTYIREHPNSAEKLLAGQLLPGDRILSEDPTVPVSHGQRPVVLDPFMLTRVGAAHPAWVQDLRKRIEGCEFDKVVLLLDINDPANWSWYVTQHFGEQVATAIRDRYHLSAQAQGYYIYTPFGNGKHSGQSDRCA